MTSQDVKFGEWIGEAFDSYKDNIVPLVLASLIAAVLSVITMGVLAGPMLAGLVLIVLDISGDKKAKVDVTRVFDGFQFFLQFFFFMLAFAAILIVASAVLSAVVCVGAILLPAFSVGLCSLLMFAPFLMVDKQMPFWDASMASFNAVKSNFWPLLGYAVVALAIGASGTLVCGVGAFATAPIALCLIAVAYRELGIGDLAPAGVPVEEGAPADETIEVEVKAPAPVESSSPAEEAPAAEAEPDGEEPKPQG